MKKSLTFKVDMDTVLNVEETVKELCNKDLHDIQYNRLMFDKKPKASQPVSPQSRSPMTRSPMTSAYGSKPRSPVTSVYDSKPRSPMTSSFGSPLNSNSYYDELLTKLKNIQKQKKKKP